MGASTLWVAATLLLAGCAGPVATPDETAGASDGTGSPSATSIVETRAADAEDASLVVFVTDEFEQPIPDAHVALTGTDLFGETNETGVVRFDKVAPGKYDVHVTRDLYQPLAATVDVGKGLVTELTIRLVPEEGLESRRPHFHDYWGGQSEVTLFENAKWDISCVGYEYVCVKDGEPSYGYHGFRFPSGSFVYPGTGEVQIKVTWSQSANPALGLFVYYPKGNQKLVFAKSGDSFSIAANPERTDPPHVQTSRWFLVLDTQATNHQGAWIGPFQVSVTLRRGDYELPFDPPHPDYFGDRNSIRMDERNLSYGYAMAATIVNAPGKTVYSFSTYLRFPEGRIVYPDADELVVRAWVNETASSDDLVFEFTPDHSIATSGNPFRRYYLPPTSVQGLLHEWRIPLEADWVDDVYATQSKWGWLIHPDYITPVQGQYSVAAYVGDIHLVIDLVKHE